MMPVDYNCYCGYCRFWQHANGGLGGYFCPIPGPYYANEHSWESESDSSNDVGWGKGQTMWAGKGDLGNPQDLPTGKGDFGKGDLAAGKGDLGKGDLGKGDLGKGNKGMGDVGKGETRDDAWARHMRQLGMGKGKGMAPLLRGMAGTKRVRSPSP